jgi:hypothetical protein
MTVRFSRPMPNIERLTAHLPDLQDEISQRCPTARVEILYARRNPIDPRFAAVAVGLIIYHGLGLDAARKEFGKRLGDDLYDMAARFAKRFVKPPKRRKKPKRGKRLR